MNLFTLQVVVLVTSLSFMLAQLFVSKKHTSHILFAMFCGSVALMTVKQLSGETLGSYKYLIGMAACATCNGYWLLSRSLFRGETKHSFASYPCRGCNRLVDHAQSRSAICQFYPYHIANK